MRRRNQTEAKPFTGRAQNRPERDTLLLPYQTSWVRDKARLKLMEKSRQIGLSWAEAYSVVRSKSFVEAALDHWISSRDEIQARLFLEDCKAFAGLLQIGAEDLGEKVIDEKGHSAFVLQFANGLRAHSMSSNADAQAGKRGGRTLDEFALHPDPRRLYAIAYPGITWGGSMSIFSTHRGSGNYFNELIREAREDGNPKGISLHRVTLQDALDQGFLYKLQTKLPEGDPRQAMDEAEYFDFIRAGAPDEETFAEEYMCVPSDDNAAFLTFELIASCEYKAGEDWETDLEDAKGPLYIGVDIGRRHDLTVISVLERLGDVLYTRRLIELKGMPFSRQEEIIWPILATPGVRRACFDNTGLGMQLAERAQERFGVYKVEPVTFSGPVKEALAYPLRSAFEDRAIRIPRHRALAADLRAVKKETTAAGNIRFAADRGVNGHADRFWSLALAVEAAKSAAGPFAWVPVVRSGESGFGRRDIRGYARRGVLV